MSNRLFSERERDDLFARAMPSPPLPRVTLQDLSGAVLLGAGVYSRSLMPHLRAAGVEPGWFVDSNPERHGTRFFDVEVKSLDSLSTVGQRPVIVMTHHFRSMLEILGKYEVRNWGWFTAIQEVFGNYSFCTSPQALLSATELDQLASLFAWDSNSIDVLKKALTFRVTGYPSDLPRNSGNAYFLDSMIDKADLSYFVDCGAFEGDTLREWLTHLDSAPSPSSSRYYAFEPDPLNIQKLSSTVASLAQEQRKCVEIFNAAVGSEAGSCKIVTGGLTSALSRDLSSGETVRVVRVDDALKGRPVTTIKMDIEGFEPNALLGCRETITRNQPTLMIAIYHIVEHFWEIPLWIHELMPEYRMFLRHHGDSFSETVCYALPAQRIKGEANR